MKQAVIKAEKIVFQGEKAYQITEFEGVLSSEKLPKQYTNSSFGEPYFFLLNNEGKKSINCSYFGVNFYSITKKQHTNTRGSFVRVYDIFFESEFSSFIEKLKEAGERLTKINKITKELKETWNGEITITI